MWPKAYSLTREACHSRPGHRLCHLHCSEPIRKTGGGGGPCAQEETGLYSVQAPSSPRGHEIKPTSVLLCPFAAVTLALDAPVKLVPALGPWQSHPQPGMFCIQIFTHWLLIKLQLRLALPRPPPSRPRCRPSHRLALFTYSAFSICDDLAHIFVCLSVTLHLSE